MMSTSTLLFLIASGQFLLSVQGLTLRLKGKEIIPDGGQVDITDLPVGGCRRYDSLECLSEVPYRGKVEEAYWVYTDLDTCEDHVVDDIRCKKDDDHECWKFGWQSTLGIYKKDEKYYSVVRLGRQNETAASGVFTCHFKGDSNPPVSASINYIGCTPTVINATNVTGDDYTHTTIFWDAPCGVADSYTIYYFNRGGAPCRNITDVNETFHTFKDGEEMQIVARRKNSTVCSKVYDITNSEEIKEIEEFTAHCMDYCKEE